MKQRNDSCELRIDANLTGRIGDLAKLWEGHCKGEEDEDSELGTLAEYGLSFEYVPPGTYDDQPEAFFRYLLSWGGPSDEFRFYVNVDLSCHRIEYWFLDWFDGAHRVLTGEHLRLLMQLWRWIDESGGVQAALQAA